MANFIVKALREVALPADTNDHTITLKPNISKRDFNVRLKSSGTIDVDKNQATSATSPTYATPDIKIACQQDDVIHVRGAVGSEIINVSIEL